MLCAEFLERHSEFRDGLISTPRELRRFARHLAHCASCRRYDETVREAVQALHASSPITPSPDFRQRLDARIAVERRRVPRSPARSGVAAALLVLAALALFVFEASRRPVATKAPVLPPVTFPQAVANPGLPFVSFQDPRSGVLLILPATASR